MTALAISVVLAIAASSDAQQAARDPSSSIAWTAYRSEAGDRSQIAALEALVPALLDPDDWEGRSPWARCSMRCGDSVAAPGST